jgi:hypothetical protein
MTRHRTGYMAIAVTLLAGNPAWSLAAEVPGKRDWPKPTVPLIIYTDFQKSAPLSVTEPMKREVETIMSPLGMPFRWSPLQEADGRSQAAQLAVVTFRGKCDASSWSPGALSGPLGWTYATQGEIVPYADVDCDRIRDFIHRELLYRTPIDADLLLARAAARVLAHELYHVLTRTSTHASGGLSKPNVSAQELTGIEFGFNPKELRSLRAALSQAREVLNLLGGRTEGSAVVGRSIYQESECSACHGSRGQGTKRGPALRGKEGSLDFKTLAARLAPDIHIYINANRKFSPESLQEYELRDLMSFLSQLQ